jgi:glutamate carboxypeptidase
MPQTVINVDAVASAIHAYMCERRDDIARLARKLCEHESPTDTPHALGVIAAIVEEQLEELDFACARREPESRGRSITAAREWSATGDYQVLVGHLDTVWPLGTLKAMPVEERDGAMWGPGVFDMKAGVAQMLFAIRAIRDLDLPTPVAPVVFLSTDEEEGSPASRAPLLSLAAAADRCLILEPAVGVSGALKTARLGVGRFDIAVAGRAAHAGLDADRGVSAIAALMHVGQKILRLARPPDILVNIGVISGGTRRNVVAEKAAALVEIRVRRRSDMIAISREMQSIASSTDAVVTIDGAWDTPPLERTERNRQLWRIAQRCAIRLAYEITETSVGSASDGNLTSEVAATLDGLGAVGDGAHAVDEHASIGAMADRAALLALLLMEPPMRELA